MRNKTNRARRARIRSVRAAIHQRIFTEPEEPEKKNTNVFSGVWVGNQDDPTLLEGLKITRVIHLDRMTIVLQPHDKKTPGHPPQLSFYAAYDYNRKNFLKDFDDLCRIIHVELLLDHNVLIYLSQTPPRDEYSRVQTLLMAYKIYSHSSNFRGLKKREPKGFKGVKRYHVEQLRVWGLMTSAEDSCARRMEYEGWVICKRYGVRWNINMKWGI